MLIESLEKKTKLAMFTVLLAVSASAVTCGLCAAGQRPTAAGVCAGREHPVYGRA